MAGSSSSSSQKGFRYDVFLSFRGLDTRSNFIDHLYKALQDKGIYTYKDDRKITKGEMIRDELLGSIEDAQFYVIVFSKNYASSSWCLDELVKIMECHKTTNHTAYPVFYDVEPTEVRWQTGVVGEAFSVHTDDEASGKWRIALKQAADLAGWELKNTANGSEAMLIQKIIEDISLKLHTIDFSFDKMLVGIEDRVNDIVSSLQIGSDDVRMIGIKGMGGAGKTTLARAIFDKISYQFEGKSFVENVREVTSNPLSGLKLLQQQILSDVLNDKDTKVSDVGEGKHILKRRLCGRKVLIALDDVDDIQQLEALAGEPEWFKSGSRVIITTRDEQVLLSPHRVILIRNVNLLSNEEAICLFSRYAFGREGPVQGYEELSEQVVHYASGLPLTIKVLGSQLFGKDKPEWEDALQRLKTIPLKTTLKILELSYNILEDDQKEIFLDLVCIMKGWGKDRAIEVLESCGFRAKFGLRVLQQKSLITIDAYGRVGMHDHIEEMGRNIVRGSHPSMPHKHSRLWNPYEIQHVLANDLGTEETRCMQFHCVNVNPYTSIKGIVKMKRLRYLCVVVKSEDQSYLYDTSSPSFLDDLGYLCLNLYPFRSLRKTCSPSFPDALEYLSMIHYPFRSLPNSFQANNLVTLKMPWSKVVQLWEGGEHKVLDKLRFLDLSHSKLRTLDLQLAPNLETLNLKGCSDLVELPDGKWTLKHLRSLDLDNCWLLKKLPNGIFQSRCLEMLALPCTKIKHLPDCISMLKHLKHVDVRGCLLLTKLPEDLGELECLELLELSSTKVKHLPNSICKLKHLNYLDLQRCLLLEKLPEDLGELESLEILYLSYTNIKHLPDSICKLKHLKRLCLHNSLFEKLPEDLGELECLVFLELSSTKIKHLPDSICKLKHLRYLYLKKSLFEKLPEDLDRLECLKELYLVDTCISHLPQSILELKGLKLYGSIGLLQSVFTSEQIQTNRFHGPYVKV